MLRSARAAALMSSLTLVAHDNSSCARRVSSDLTDQSCMYMMGMTYT